MTTRHSVWLMPGARDEALLQEFVDELARDLGGLRFRPHLTLVEDLERDHESLTPAIREVAEGIESFAAPVAAIDAGALYFRSLYARFTAAGVLLDLKRRAMVTIAPAGSRPEDFLPHVSFAYGIEQGPRKRAATEMLTRRLVGAQIGFDRICVVASAKEIPVADWAVRSTVVLDGAGKIAADGGESYLRAHA